MRRLDQYLASTAATALRESGIAQSDGDLRSRMASLPAMLQASGLPATCAFLLAKNQPEDLLAATALLREAAAVAGLDPGGAPLTLLDRLADTDEHRLAVAEQRAAMLATWLSRLAVARFKAST